MLAHMLLKVIITVITRSTSSTYLNSKSDKLCNLDFQAESPQTMPHNNDNDFLYY